MTDSQKTDTTQSFAESHGKRQFLKKGAALGMKLSLGSSLLLTAQQGLRPSVAQAANKLVSVELYPNTSRRLHLVNAHTWDDYDVVYFTQGVYIDENVSRLNHLMRDRRANVSTSMDTGLYDQLLRLQRVLGTTEPVHVLSGYRTPETNAKLRRRSPGVAKYSLHMEGRAADIYIPGISVKRLQRAALTLQAGGVGLYSKSNFVHVDTGAVRRWGS